MKYLYKYIYKGHDRASFFVFLNRKMIVLLMKSICSNQQDGFHRLKQLGEYAFHLNDMHPSVVSLQLHLPNMQSVVFHASQNLMNILSDDIRTKTMLTEVFEKNRSNSNARQYLYHEFPEHYVWHHKDKFWSKRKNCKCVGRIVAANPTEGESYFLRLLLLHVKGPTSFNYLRTVNGNHVLRFEKSQSTEAF